MSKKSWPILYSNLLYKLGQDFLAIQYEDEFRTDIYMIKLNRKKYCAGKFFPLAKNERGQFGFCFIKLDAG